MDLNTKKIFCSLKNKKFFNILTSNTNSIIKINLTNIYLPFGKENYNGKEILNIELDKTDNTHNNYISVLSSLENRIKEKKFECDVNVLQQLVNKSFLPTLKESKIGYILRTHLSTTTEIYIEKKDKSKFLITSDNLKNSYVDITVTLKGGWINTETYGLYWDINEIKVNKFNN